MADDPAPLQASSLKLPPHLDALQALRESHFVPFFQPLITLRTGQLAGFEVLARWQHPNEGLIPPNTFIPIAEQDGWIGDLMRQVLEKAFVTAGAAFPDLTLAINISPLQLRDSSLPEQLRALSTDAGFPLSRLVVEITESALIDNLQSAASIVAELKAMGCRLALDDFGTGYSSLSHLQALPFDKLKVDRSFVGSMTSNRESRKIVSAVVGLGQSLGLITVAEGIETQEQAEMMLWLGCDFGQGYFFGRPMPAEALPACVSAKREKLLISQASAWKRISAAHLESSPTQRRAQLQAVYDGAPVGLAFLDQNLRYVTLNQRLADMNGAPLADHLGSPVAEMIPELFPHVEPYIRRALKGEAVPDIEAHVETTGQTRLISYHPVMDEAGEVIGVSIAGTDITELKRTEEALKRSEAHHRSMVELNPQVLWIMDPDGENLDVSPRWDEHTGLMKSQTTHHAWLESVHPADKQPTETKVSESRRNGSLIDVQYRVSDGEGNWLWKRSRGAPRYDPDGKIVCWYGSVQDIGNSARAPEAISRIAGTAANAMHPVRVEEKTHDQTEEELRSRTLHELEILDTPAEAEFDDLVYLASQLFSTPTSCLALVDGDRLWFKASIGPGVTEATLQSSFCQYAFQRHEPLIVEDALKDARFKEAPFVVGYPHFRFYAGVSLNSRNGVAIGTLCVLDQVPRTPSPDQVKALSILGRQVEAAIELRSVRTKYLSRLVVQRDTAASIRIQEPAVRPMQLQNTSYHARPFEVVPS